MRPGNGQFFAPCCKGTSIFGATDGEDSSDGEGLAARIEATHAKDVQESRFAVAIAADCTAED